MTNLQNTTALSVVGAFIGGLLSFFIGLLLLPESLYIFLLIGLLIGSILGGVVGAAYGKVSMTK